MDSLSLSLLIAIDAALVLFGVMVFIRGPKQRLHQTTIRHRLTDIRLVVARFIAYSLLVLILGGGYAASLFILQGQIFASADSTAQITVSSVLALVMALTFQPLRSFLEQITDGIFFRDRYDATELLGRLSKIVSSTIILDTLAARVLHEVLKSLRIQGGAIFIQDDREKTIVHDDHLLPRKVSETEIEALFHHRHTRIRDDLPEGQQKALLRALGISLVVPLAEREGVIGLIALGDKKSGDPYSREDIDVLEILAPELAVGVQNARAYHQIERFNETLRLRIERATRKLREANEHLRELDEAKDEFISLASHQLRTPLTAIRGYLSMIEEGDVGKLTKAQADFVGEASEGAARMVDLIDDLLNVSRMDAGRFMIDRSAVDLAKLTDEEIHELTPHARSKDLKLTYRPPKERVPTLQLDETKTRQVLINFIDNAIYYTQEGEITVSLEQVGETVELRVRDTGIGIPPADQTKLFTKFYRAPGARGLRPDGTGLGLYLAKRVIEEQGGEVIFESSPGKGSTFGFRFPVTAPAHHPLSPAQVATHHRRRAKHLVG